MTHRDSRSSRRILLPLETPQHSSEACRHARALARGAGGDITLLHVLDRSGEAGRPPPPVDPLEWHLHKIERQMQLDALAAPFRRAGIDTKTVIEEGQATENIVDYCNRHGIDLAIVTRPFEGAGRIGRTVQELLQRTGTSILMVPAGREQNGPGDEVHYRTVLVPLDGSTRAECCLPLATSLARGHGARLLLGHVVKEPDIPRRTPPSEDDLELVRRLTERNRQEVAGYLEQLDARLDVTSEIRLRTDHHVAGSLHELVAEEEVDLVVLSAHGYSGESRWSVGSVTSNFLAHGTTPLLLVQDLPSRPSWRPHERVTVERWG